MTIFIISKMKPKAHKSSHGICEFIHSLQSFAYNYWFDPKKLITLRLSNT